MTASTILDERSGSMKRSQFTEEQMVYALRQAESGTPKRSLITLALFISCVLSLCTFIDKSASGKNGNEPQVLDQSTSGDKQSRSSAERYARTLSDSSSSLTEREQILVDLFKTLDIGIYNSKGETIHRGAERNSNDFYLYDFEIMAMANATARQADNTIAGIVATLGQFGLSLNNKKVSSEDLSAAITSACSHANENPDGTLSLIPLLIRELGLLKPTPYDLATTPPSDSTPFDALQSFLIVLDVVLPVLASHDTATVRRPMDGIIENVVQVRYVPVIDIGDLCTQLKSGGPAYAKAGGILAGLLGKLPEVTGIMEAAKVAGKIGVVATAIDGLHGMLLAFSIKVEEVNAYVSTHYGHGGPGQELRASIKVTMLDDYGKIFVQCGWVAGADMPPAGPVAGVQVVWLYGNLKKHGEIVCEESTCNRTGTDGVATLVLRPKVETKTPKPADKTLSDQGNIIGVAFYQSRFNNILGSVNQVLTPKVGLVIYRVSWHQPRVWRGKSKGTFTTTGGESNWTAIGEADVSFAPADSEDGNAEGSVLHLKSLPGGTLSYSISGNQGPCSVSGSGTIAAGGEEDFLDINMSESPPYSYLGYGISGVKQSVVTMSCPLGSGQTQLPLPGWFYAPEESKTSADGSIIEGTHTKVEGEATGTWHWRFVSGDE
jgi:hypothetical protein